MAERQARQRIPLELSEAQFNEFVLPHLPRGRRGPLPRLPLYRIFNYILKALYLGCQWHTLPIDRNQQARREIHPTSIYRIFRRWQASGCFDAIFLASVRRLQQDPVARSVDHSRRRHNDCGKERRRQSRYQWRRRPSLLTPTGSSFRGSEGFCVMCPPVS
ncbi:MULTISPECIES: transposase [unclassified Paraburkholderia]|uniref:transposase n=1 Tax=unclassified Paraburkholderia TaxID=2615204 RepID=UPI00288B2C1E|nr:MULTISPECIES: transposase [unclassified Paraburkholderia]